MGALLRVQTNSPNAVAIGFVSKCNTLCLHCKHGTLATYLQPLPGNKNTMLTLTLLP